MAQGPSHHQYHNILRRGIHEACPADDFSVRGIDRNRCDPCKLRGGRFDEEALCLHVVRHGCRDLSNTARQVVQIERKLRADRRGNRLQGFTLVRSSIVLK